MNDEEHAFFNWYHNTYGLLPIGDSGKQQRAAWLAALAHAHRDASQQDYRKAVDDELVVRHIGVAKGNPKLEINQIVEWEIMVHDDPAVSEVARERADKLASQQAETDRLKGELALSTQLLRRLIMICDNGQPKDCYVITRSGTLIDDVRAALDKQGGG